MSRRILLILFAFVLATPGIAQKSVFIYAGQSNADGREVTANLPDYLKVANHSPYRYLQYADIVKQSDGTFGQRVFGTRKNDRYAFCDITNYWIEQALQTEFYAVKCAYGGTALDPTARPQKVPTWCIDDEWLAIHNAYAGQNIELDSFKMNNSLAKGLVERFRLLEQITLNKLREGYEVKAIMWMQGESDSKPKTAENQYYERLKKLISYFRTNIAPCHFILATMPHKSRQYSRVIENAHYRLARELPYVHLVDMSGSTLRSDQIHIDARGTDYLGKAMYNKLVELHLVKGNPVNLPEFSTASELR